MPILCIHNPFIHKDPQQCHRVEVAFTQLHTCPQEALDQLLSTVPVSEESNKLFDLAKGWVHYRPSRVGPVLCLPCANGNRKVTVMVWLEEDQHQPVNIPEKVAELNQTGKPMLWAQAKPKDEVEPKQIFNQSELARIKELTSGATIVESNPMLDNFICIKASRMLEESK